MLLRNLLTYIEQVFRLCAASAPRGSLKVILWGEGVEMLETTPQMGGLPFRCAGKANVGELAMFLTRQPANGSFMRLLFVSDGHWHPDEVAAFVEWRKSTPSISLRVIAVGCDANFRLLREAAGASPVFTSEDVYAALQCWEGGLRQATRGESTEGTAVGGVG